MREYRLDSVVDEEWPPMVAAFLKSAGGGPVRITINSPGGSAFAGAAIYGQLRSYRGPVEIAIEGLAASAASLIAMGASPGLLKIHGGGFLMIHEASAWAEGPAADHRQTADLLERVSATYRRAYADRSGLSEAEIAALMKAETWMGAEDAVARGFADEVLGPIRIAASVDLSAFDYRNAPCALRAGPQGDSTMSVTVETKAGDVQAATAQEIAQIAAKASLGPQFVAEHIEARTSLANVQAAALDAMAAAASAAVTPSTLRVVRDEGEAFELGVAEYVAARIVGRPPQGAGERFKNHRMADVLAARLEAQGRRVPRGATPTQISAMLTRDDLPLLTKVGTERALLELYPTVRSPLVELAEIVPVQDFRPKTLIRLASHRPLDLVAEAGEVTVQNLVEAGEPIQIARYSNLHIVSSQVIISDDMGGFGAFVRAAAQASAGRERALLTGLLTMASGAGPTLSDSLAWFATARGNIGTGSPMDVAALADAIAKLRALKDSDGQTVHGLEPYAIVVSPAREYAARQLVASLSTVSTRAEVQPWSLRVIVESGLTGNRWWLATTPATRRSLALGFLDGRELPTVETFEEADVHGTKIRITFDCAAAVADPVGWVTNAGT